MEQAAHRAGRLRGTRRLLHLAENLGLADHHGIESRGDAESVAHRLLAGQRIEVRLQLVGGEPVILRKPARELARPLPSHVDLSAVAGGEDRRFASQTALELAERLVQALDMEHHALSHRERRRDMVQPKREQRCGQGRDYTRLFSLPSSLQSAFSFDSASASWASPDISPAKLSRAATSRTTSALAARSSTPSRASRENSRDTCSREVPTRLATSLCVGAGSRRARFWATPASRARRASSSQMRRCTGCAPSSSRRSASSRSEPVRRRSSRSATEA